MMSYKKIISIKLIFSECRDATHKKVFTKPLLVPRSGVRFATVYTTINDANIL